MNASGVTLSRLRGEAAAGEDCPDQQGATTGVRMPTVLIADGHARLAEIMAQLLADEPGFAVLPVVHSPADAVQAVQTRHPDVVLVSERLGREAGLAVCAAVRAQAPDATVLVWSHQPERVPPRSDVDGVLERGMTFRELVRAILRARRAARAR